MNLLTSEERAIRSFGLSGWSGMESQESDVGVSGRDLCNFWPQKLMLTSASAASKSWYSMDCFCSMVVTSRASMLLTWGTWEVPWMKTLCVISSDVKKPFCIPRPPPMWGLQMVQEKEVSKALWPPIGFDCYVINDLVSIQATFGEKSLSLLMKETKIIWKHFTNVHKMFFHLTWADQFYVDANVNVQMLLPLKRKHW